MSGEVEAIDDVVDGELVGDEVEPAGPEPLVRIRASIYESAKGGVIVAFRADGMEGDGHIEIKPAMLKLLGKMTGAGGDPLEALKAMFGPSEVA